MSRIRSGFGDDNKPQQIDSFRSKGWIVLILMGLGLSSHVKAQESEELAKLLDKMKGQVSRCWLAPGVPNTLQQFEATDALTIEGLILEIDEKGLVYVKPGDTKVIRVPGDQVISVRIAWGSLEAEKAHALYREEKYLEGVQAAQKALGSGILKWQQRILVAEMVHGLAQSGRMSLSGELFLRLAKERPPAFLYATAPLLWVHQELDRTSLENASKWLSGSEESAKLLGASWLLSGNRGEEAIRSLEELSKSKNPTIARLATIQLWRRVPAAQVASERIPEWSAMRDSLLQPLQWGPTLLLADKLDQSGKVSLAIPEWIRFATIHADHPRESAECIRRALSSLRGLKQDGEAQRLEAWFSNKAVKKE